MHEFPKRHKGNINRSVICNSTKQETAQMSTSHRMREGQQQEWTTCVNPTDVNEDQWKPDMEYAIYKVPVPVKDLWGREADQRRGGSGSGLVILRLLV